MSLTSTVKIASAALAAVLLAAPAHADGDAAKGKKVFNKCKACHNADSEKNKVGPHLVGLFGRKAGSLEDYSYSDAMASSDVVWSAETLATYLEKPKDFIPGTKMVFAGLKKEDQIEDVIAYLEEATKK
ncbi:MAG TPA: cytochrome c family protein, partial [Afifellaceae bacterium]|nr:cytochrome c family protein [Afifellaceae bacterium]